MTPRVKALYQGACDNKDFLDDIWEADRDKKPGIFAGAQEKHMFAALYYGWLVGKYKSRWKEKGLAI